MAVTIVQANMATNTSGSPGTTGGFALPSATTNGNTVVIGIQLYGSVNGATVPDVLTCGDGGHNTFSRATASSAQHSASTYGLHTVFYYATGIVGQATHTIVFTLDTAAYMGSMAVWELSASSFDQACASTGNGAVSGNTSMNAGTLTPSQNGSVELYLANVDHTGVDGFLPAAWTVLAHSSGGNGATMTAYSTQTTAAPYAFTMDTTDNSAGMTWTASGAVFVPPGGAPDPTILRTISSPRLV